MPPQCVTCSMASEISDIKANVVEIHTTVKLLKEELIGNGQPGRMTNAENRISALEGWMNRVSGIMIAAGAVFSGAMAALWAKVTGKL